jgi:uncharacterized protein (TIGR00251 family)
MNRPRSNRFNRQPRRLPPPPAARPAPASNQEFKIEAVDDGIAFDVHVVPRAAKSHVAGMHGDRLHVKVNAPPIEGAANQAVRATIAKALGVPLRQVSIIRGVASRLKRVHVSGLNEAEARKAFAL